MNKIILGAVFAIGAGTAASAVEVKIQGLQHVQQETVVYTDLPKGEEQFYTCYGYTEAGEIIATASGYAIGPVHSDELYFNTAEASASIVRVQCSLS